VEEEKELKEALFKLKAARLAAIKRWPYFDTNFMAMALVPKKEIPTVGTDTLGRFYFNTRFVLELSVPELATMWQHEVLHTFLEHYKRVNGRSFRDWNIAADCEINDDLQAEGCPFPSAYPPHLPTNFDLENGKLAEYYFEHIHDEDENEEDEEGEGEGESGSEGEGEGSSEGGDSPPEEDGGSSMDGRQRSWEDGPEAESGVEEISAALLEVLKQQASEKIEEHAKNVGRVPLGILNKARENLSPPKIPWQKELASAVRACVADVAGAVDFTYKKPSRRQSIYGRFVMPASRRPIPDTAIVLDTSASMFGGDLDDALSETQGVIRALGGKGVRVLATDSQVHSQQKVTRASKVETLGGGGTDMRVGIEATRKLRPKIDLCIVITDGESPWPRVAPKGMRVIIVLTRNGSRRRVPEWARVVQVAD
tara:strand:+ start:3663 stop:4937 length:1275 start_codon:yes stop_codon:yes gene_type:complete